MQPHNPGGHNGGHVADDTPDRACPAPSDALDGCRDRRRHLKARVLPKYRGGSFIQNRVAEAMSDPSNDD